MDMRTLLNFLRNSVVPLENQSEVRTCRKRMSYPQALSSQDVTGISKSEWSGKFAQSVFQSGLNPYLELSWLFRNCTVSYWLCSRPNTDEI